MQVYKGNINPHMIVSAILPVNIVTVSYVSLIVS